MLFLSPKNSLDGHLSVLEAADCNIWLTTADYSQNHEILDKRPMQTVQLPSLTDVLDPKKVEMYPYNKTYDEAKDDSCWVLHTSGSTGLPKPVFRFMSSTASNESHLLCGPIEGRPLLIDETIGARICMTFPLFHVRYHALLSTQGSCNITVIWAQ
jgi:acyl-CoA synthetase (AMP-forming)/AMP-acid ligase II